MRVVNKNEKITGYLTFEDLESGEAFRFLDNASIFLCSDDACIINIESGELIDVYASGCNEKPIERIKCYLVIE